MNNTTNHNNVTLFSKKNEERIVAAIEKLVDHITTKPMSKEYEDWLAQCAESEAAPQSPVHDRQQERISMLEHQLREANAKLSRRF